VAGWPEPVAIVSERGDQGDQANHDERAENGDRRTGNLPTALRRERVAEAIRRSKYTSVTDLAETFDVSEVTIRSDLDVLAEAGQIRRVRGGAVHRVAGTLEVSFEQDSDTMALEKAAIGRLAASLVDSGQTIMLDIGSTVAAVARSLAQRADLQDVSAITNGLRVALELEVAEPNIEVLVTGGTLRRLQHSLVNPFGTILLDQLHAHMAIVSCNGIEAQAGVTNTNVGEAEVKRLMLKSGRRRIVVADGSKVGQVSLVHVFPSDEVDVLVTDSSADPAAVAALRDRGIEVHIAD